MFCLNYLKQVFPDEFEAFLRSSIFDKAVFCLGEEQGMLLNDEYSSWYNRVVNLLLSVWDRKKKILYGSGSSDYVSQTNPTPECKVNCTKYYGG